MRKSTLILPLLLGCIAPLAPAQSTPPAAAEPVFSNNRVKFSQQGGETLYRTICQGCHMPHGQGGKGAGFYPALASNPRLAASGYPVFVVMKGLHGMPDFSQRLDDQQIADVVNFVRTSFGNTYTDAVKPEDVAPIRNTK